MSGRNLFRSKQGAIDALRSGIRVMDGSNRICGVRVEDLTFGYAGASRPVLRQVSLVVEPGEKVALVGPNGAGKTTLLLHLNGLLRPTRGRVQIGDLDVVEVNLDDVRGRVGLVFQDPDDQLFMPTLLEDVAFGPLCHGASRPEAEARAREALRAVGLQDVDAGRAAHHLSGGEKRRAALATILSLEPGVLALDEPTDGLDARGRRQLADLLRARPQTVVLVTHDIEFVAAVCPRMVILEDGRVVQDTPSSRLLAEPDRLWAHGLAGPGALLDEAGYRRDVGYRTSNVECRTANAEARWDAL